MKEGSVPKHWCIDLQTENCIRVKSLSLSAPFFDACETSPYRARWESAFSRTSSCQSGNGKSKLTFIFRFLNISEKIIPFNSELSFVSQIRILKQTARRDVKGNPGRFLKKHGFFHAAFLSANACVILRLQLLIQYWLISQLISRLMQLSMERQ